MQSVFGELDRFAKQSRVQPGLFGHGTGVPSSKEAAVADGGGGNHQPGNGLTLQHNVMSCENDVGGQMHVADSEPQVDMQNHS